MRSLTVRYTPQSLGTHSCRLKVSSNDADEPAVYIPLTASTPAPLTLGGAEPGVPGDGHPERRRMPDIAALPGDEYRHLPATVQSITIGGVNGANYSLSGAPAIPITLNPGEQVGDGALQTVFKPDVVDRDRLGSIAITWLSDPIASTTTTETRLLCGEGTLTGARVLIRVAGVPVSVVDKIQIHRITANRNKDMVDTVGNFMNVPLQTVTPAGGTACLPFQYHQEVGTVSNGSMLAPGSYTVTATVTIGKKKETRTVAFSTETCTFNPTVIIDF